MKPAISILLIASAVFLLNCSENSPPASEANKAQFTVYSSVDNDPDIYPDNDKLETFNSYPIDKRMDTEWTTWRPQKPGDWLMLDMGKEYKLSQVVLDDRATVLDFPRGFVFETTDQPPEKSLNDDGAWRKVAEFGAEATNERGITTIKLEHPVNTRYFRIILTKNSPRWWSVYNIELQ
jgi:hypothetical protein